MPVSKHRRKPGGKSVRHPGRARAPTFRLDYESSAHRAFAEKYTVPFFAAHGADHFAAEMLDIISDEAFVLADGAATLEPVSKAQVFRKFLEPLPADDDSPPKQPAPRLAEAALSFLSEQGLVEVDGDRIIVPARFLNASNQESSNSPT